jgi:N-acetylglucosamine kinase-like BadF-type ATPase
MILVAESGSTKTRWCTITKQRIDFVVNTPGINPLLMSNEEIQGIIRPVLAGFDAVDVEEIYFFGAGCANNSLKEKIGKVLYSVFECKEIWVDSDLIAACLALSGNQPSVVGLLGTGSNSCLWDGSGIRQQTPSLGYVLGDEGGGVSIGKQLVSDFLKKQMPGDLWLKFSERYDVSAEIVIQRVYQTPMPNRYLASFAPFAEEYIGHIYCKRLVTDKFESFVKRNLLQYQNIDRLPVHFCGTIAWCHQNELREVCKGTKLNMGNIIKEPIEGLAEYLKVKKFGNG